MGARLTAMVPPPRYPLLENGGRTLEHVDVVREVKSLVRPGVTPSSARRALGSTSATPPRSTC